MATWTMKRVGTKVKLTYNKRPSDPAEQAVACGEIDSGAAERDLEAWAFDTAEVWDRIETPDGTFVRQAPGVFGTRA
jgi:hypothetical protein